MKALYGAGRYICFGHWSFWISSLFRISSFGFRIYRNNKMAHNRFDYTLLFITPETSIIYFNPITAANLPVVFSAR